MYILYREVWSYAIGGNIAVHEWKSTNIVCEWKTTNVSHLFNYLYNLFTSIHTLL